MVNEDSSDAIDVDEADCSTYTEADSNTDVEVLSEADSAAIDRAIEFQDWSSTFGSGLGPVGGGWGGAQHPIDRAQAIGRRNGLQVTSRKRSTGSPGSDHHTSQRRSDAVDLSNGSSPTPQMDRTAAQVAALLGVPGWRGGVLSRTVNGYRVQLLYRTSVGGNHFNHVHVGVRVN